jgi:hypothetical protein
MTTPEAHGEVSPESMENTASSAVGSPSDAQTAPPHTTGNTAEQNRLKPCRGKLSESMKRVEVRKSKRKFPLIPRGAGDQDEHIELAPRALNAMTCSV